MFIEALFRIAKIVKQHVSVKNEWIKKFKNVLLVIKILNLVICGNMDGPGEYYVKWNKSEKNKYCMISLIRVF